MTINFTQIEKNLISEIKLTILQSKIFLLVVTKGKMTADQISKNLEISLKDA